MKYKLGSLFDGSGGFPLAGSLCDIEPVWAAEVEPYPVAVTRSRFPNMKHYGDVSKINGAEVEPVNILTFGAPCQDLSVAGLRKGLRHTDNGDEETTRSGLFMEAVRIIREMREATNGRYPDFAVYENVPGAFSSSGGEDWRTVLQSLIQIVEPGAVMPDVPKGGWAYADWFMGEGWSLAYRVLDAQFWGVPQRRRRIYLVLDLRGERAGKILFEREGLRGYFAESRTPWQAAAGDAQADAGADDREGAVPYTLKIRSGCDGGGKGALIQTDLSATLATNNDQYLFQPVGCDLYSHAITGDTAATLTSMMHKGGTMSGPTVAVPNLLLDDQGGSQISVRTDDKSPTLRAEAHGNVPAVVEQAALPFDTTQITSPMNYSHPKFGDPCHPLAAGAHPPAVVCMATQQGGAEILEDKCPTITAAAGMSGNNQPVVCMKEQPPVYCIDGDKIGKAERAGGSGLGIRPGDKMYTLTAKDAGSHAVAYGISSYDSNAMKSSNPHSGIYEATTSRTLDLNGGNPACNQGGIAIVDPVLECQGMDCRNGELNGDLCGTLQAKPGGGFSYNCIHPVILKTPVRYIVRRLTPTECARLQGFPDKWGHPDRKDSLTDEEYAFWLEVRNTHASINGKPVKDYTREQMLKWYNGLHTDSAEYKMWGNGIALPCALYVMQGIEDTLKEEELWTS